MRIFLALLFFSNIAAAQVFRVHDSAAIKIIDELPAKEPFDTAYKYRKEKNNFIYIISKDDIYSLFGYAAYVQYKDFNFTDYHIFGEQRCKQCMLYCHHEEGEEACHRNRCMYTWVWTMRENKKAFAPVPVTTLPGHTGFDGPDKQYLPQDTIIRSATDSTQVSWYTTGMGDCHGKFQYALFIDNYHPALLLKEWNYYGGCRAGGFFDVTLSFKMPPGITQHVKNTMLMNEYRE